MKKKMPKKGLERVSSLVKDQGEDDPGIDLDPTGRLLAFLKDRNALKDEELMTNYAARRKEEEPDNDMDASKKVDAFIEAQKKEQGMRNRIKELTATGTIPMAGSSMTSSHIIDHLYAKFRSIPYSEFNQKPLSVLSDWVWFDIDIESKASLEEMAGQNRKPSIIFSHRLVFDSHSRWSQGAWVLTSPLSEFHEGYIFETTNSVYALLGDGLRKKITPDDFGALMAYRNSQG